MRISDLIPWKRPKRTRVPVVVKRRAADVGEGDVTGRSGDCVPWSGLALFGALGGWWDALGPRMDMVEDSEAVIVTLEVPGLDHDDVDVTLSGNRLTIRGERRHQRAGAEPNVSRVRRAYCSFERSVTLPCRIDDDLVEATLSKGVLAVRLPKLR